MSSSKSRREFIQEIACGAAGLALLSFNQPAEAANGPKINKDHIFAVKEAMYYEKLAEDEVKCKLCPKECKVGDKERGWCGVRENSKGTYYTMVHSNPCAAHIDPIEKKPFFHYLPASLAFSISTAGCNFNCKYCQNW
ncbi:MAG: radical SAM protein, partial [Candidatus Poribacteria bacterium]